MAKFKIDDLMRELGAPRKNAPKEPGTEDLAAARPAGAADASSPPIDPTSTPLDASAPRPPDMTGDGLGSEIDPGMAARTADPARMKPDDALSSVYKPDRGDAAADFQTLVVERGIASTEELTTACRVLKQAPGQQLWQLLIDAGADEARVVELVAELARLPFERIDIDGGKGFDEAAMHRLGPDFCRESRVVPLRTEGSRLVIGTTNPDDLFLLDEVKRRLGLTTAKHVLICAGDVELLFESISENDTEEFDVEDILSDVDEDDVEVEKDSGEDGDLEAEAESSPVVRYVNHIIQTAVREGASDIHIEPDEKSLKVRFRIDGVLFEMMSPPRKMHSALTSRLKIMANLDIAERRLPQDGRIRATVLGRRLDLRVSTLPTPKGEKTVMRILDTRSINVTLDELGFHSDTLDIWKNQIAQPHGIILVTGPTGSGKTTTLYSSIRQMDTRRLNVSTVEDPVEYNLGGITQVQTHERIGMTFAAALKSLLRQDPDVIMLGEIRDLETATIAIQAALTGHLVLSTLHTNDAPSSVTRLFNIGIEPFLVGAALNAVLAQRLVRRVCPNCSEDRPVQDDVSEFLVMHGIQRTELAHGAGCSSCRETGYAGRVGLYELLLLDDFLRDKVAASPNVTEFRRTCIERGMTTLRQDGFRKVEDGRTTVEEVLRVTEATI